MKVDIARKNIHETWRAGWGGNSVLGERSAVTKEVLGNMRVKLMLVVMEKMKGD